MILVTGAAGYIGAHVLLALARQGYPVVAFDNMSRGCPENLQAVNQLLGQQVPFVHGDVRDRGALKQLFQVYPISAVVHLAGLKVIEESFSDPLAYYDHNVAGTRTLLQVMADSCVFTLIFSSSAAVYGVPDSVPVTEEHPADRATSPYGKSKQMVEQMLQDLSNSDARWRIAALRYFNPLGADASGLLGEAPNAKPANLLPALCAVARKDEACLTVYGGDLPTADGTGVRDFIHVEDLAEGHVAALQWLAQQTGFHPFNLGTGQGYSVLQVVEAFFQANGIRVPCSFLPPRPGDVNECWASVHKARDILGWKAHYDLSRMLKDAWRRDVMRNPNS